MIGMLKDRTYRQHAFAMNHGDRLFVYTDGVPEACSETGEQFGTDRMLEALNRRPDASPEELIDDVGAAIERFMGEAPRFDDTTMMCFFRC